MSVTAKLVACTRLAILLVLVLGAAFLDLFSTPLYAQGDPGATPNQQLRSRNSNIVTDLREKNFAALDEGRFNEFFTDYYLQMFAQPDVNGPHGKKGEKPLGELRTELRVRYFGAGKSGRPITG